MPQLYRGSNAAIKSSSSERSRMHKQSGIFVLVLMIGLFTVNVSSVSAKTDYFDKWPEGTSPQEIGKRVAENFLKRKYDFEKNPQRRWVIYPEVCTWYGSLTVAQLTKDKDMDKRLIDKFDFLMTTEGEKRISPEAHVDYRVFGAVP